MKTLKVHVNVKIPPLIHSYIKKGAGKRRSTFTAEMERLLEIAMASEGSHAA